jgi:hypothetical protein
MPIFVPADRIQSANRVEYKTCYIAISVGKGWALHATMVVKYHRKAVLYHLLPDFQPSNAVLSGAFDARMTTDLTHIATKMHADR